MYDNGLIFATGQRGGVIYLQALRDLNTAAVKCQHNSDLTDEADDTVFSRIMTDQPWTCFTASPARPSFHSLQSREKDRIIRHY